MKFEDMLVAMLKDPPDPNEPLPLANRKATIWGTTITFLIISWLAVFLRLFVRFRIVREPGWDDFFVTLSAVCNTVASICVIISVDYGLGHHFLYIPLPRMTKYLLLFYIENAVYISQTALIKISLLFQYLRIFKAGYMRWICISLLCIISLWGLAFGFMAWFPCFPVKGYWNKATVEAKCYGFGFSDPESFIIFFEAHTAANMTFDLLVFLTPLVLFGRPNLRKKSIIALTGIFMFGAVVVFTSVWRLQSIVENKAGTYPYIDFTWWTPISIILSCIEIDLAIVCASMPIFWPIFEKSLSQIFVTHEVHVIEERRLNEDDLEYEMGHTNSNTGSHGELGRSGSRGTLKSTSGNSEEGLTKAHTRNTSSGFGKNKDPYVVGLSGPFSGGGIATTEVEAKKVPQKKWEI